MLSGFSRLSRNTGFALLTILGIALALRLYYFQGLANTIYGNHLLTDEQLYHFWAKAIAEGDPGAFFLFDQAPLPAYFLAGLYILFSPNPLLFKITNILLGTLTCFFLYVVGTGLGGKRTGFISAVLAAIYAPFILYSAVPLKTTMALCLLSGFLALAASLSNDDRNLTKIIKFFIIGILLGLLSLVRSNSLIFIPALIVFAFFLYRKERLPLNFSLAIVVSFLGLVLAFSPFWYIQHTTSTNSSFSSSQLGRNLYYGNGPDNPTPYFYPMPFASSIPGESSAQFTIEASRRSGEDLTPEEASSFWVKAVLHYFIEEPKAALSHTLLKFKAVISSFEAGDHYNLDFLATLSPRFGLPLPGFSIIFALGIAGAVTSYRQSLLSRFMTISFLLYGLSLVIFYISARYRIPLSVFLIPWTALGISNFFAFLSEKRWFNCVIYVFLAIAAYYATQLPHRGRDDLSRYYNIHAALLNREQRIDEAIQYWNKSLAANGSFSPLARLYLSGKYYERGKRDKAFTLLDGIDDTSYVASSKYAILGDIYAHEGKKDKAIAAYLKSLDINSGQRRIRKNLINLYLKSPETRDQALQQILLLKHIEEFFKQLDDKK